jgi:hypothetical protein
MLGSIIRFIVFIIVLILLYMLIMHLIGYPTELPLKKASGGGLTRKEDEATD